MTEVKKRKREPIVLGGITYIPGEEFAKRVGITMGTLYCWNSGGRVPQNMYERYLGRIYYKELSVEPFKRSLLQK